MQNREWKARRERYLRARLDNVGLPSFSSFLVIVVEKTRKAEDERENDDE